MKEIPIFNYYAFGYDNYILINEMRGRKNDGTASIIETYLNKIKEMNLHVTYETSRGLVEISKSIRKKISENEIKPDDDCLNEITDRVMEIARNSQMTLMAELKLRKSYSLTDKRYKLDDLLNNPSAIFGSKIFENTSRFACDDFKNGCKCLAFGQATASAFHFLRGTEMVLKDYYFFHIKKGREETPMWGNMLKGLEAKRKNKPKKELLDNLRNIKDNYRNPTQHPELNYDIDAAQDLLSLTIDVINKMVFEMKKDDVELSRMLE